MKRSHTSLLALLLMPAFGLVAAEKRAASAKRPNEHFNGVEARLDGILVPKAPLVTTRSGISVHDALRWLQFTSTEMDPDGRGVTFDVRVPDSRQGRPPKSRMTMDPWYAFEDWWKFPDAAPLFHRDRRHIPRGPQIVNATVGDYLEYLLGVAGWTHRIGKGKVVIYDPTTGNKRNSEPTGRP